MKSWQAGMGKTIWQCMRRDEEHKCHMVFKLMFNKQVVWFESIKMMPWPWEVTLVDRINTPVSCLTFLLWLSDADLDAVGAGLLFDAVWPPCTSSQTSTGESVSTIECTSHHLLAFDSALTFACLGTSMEVRGMNQKVQQVIPYLEYRLEAPEESFL